MVLQELLVQRVLQDHKAMLVQRVLQVHKELLVLKEYRELRV